MCTFLSKEYPQPVFLVFASFYSRFSLTHPQAEGETDTKLVQLRDTRPLRLFEILECDFRLHISLLHHEQRLARQRHFSACQLTQRARPEAQIKWATLLLTAVGRRSGASLFCSFALMLAPGFVWVNAVFTRGASRLVSTHGFTQLCNCLASFTTLVGLLIPVYKKWLDWSILGSCFGRTHWMST